MKKHHDMIDFNVMLKVDTSEVLYEQVI